MEATISWKAESSDAELVEKAIAGDNCAFDLLVKRYQRAVYAVAFATLSDSEASRDVLQDTFLSAYCSIERLEDRSKFSSWIYAIARNRARGYYRSRRRIHSWEVSLDAAELMTHPKPNESIEAVRHALSVLTESQADVVTLYYMEGYSTAECADLLQTSVGNIKRRLYDARQKLKKEMTSMIRKHLPEFALPKDFKVVIDTSGKPNTTQAVLNDLSEMTGVSFEAGKDTRDWQIRDRKLNIVAKNVPLADLMDSIASVLNCEWSKTDGDKPVYRLYMDENIQKQAEVEKKLVQERFDAEMTRRRQRFVDTLLNWHDVSDEELERLKIENPCRYLLHFRGSGYMYQRLFKEIPMLADLLIHRKHNQAWLASKLSQETRNLIRQVLDKRFLYRGYHGSPNGNPFPEDYDINEPSSELWFEIVPRDFVWDVDENWDLGGVGYFVKDKFFYIEDMLVEDVPRAQYAARCQIRALEQGKTYHEIMDETKDELELVMQATAIDRTNCYSIGADFEKKDDPELSRNIHVNLTGDTLADYQAALAEAGGLAVVSDLYLARKVTKVVLEEKDIELRELLDAIADAYGYSWTKRGPIIEFQDKQWFAKMGSQIPAEQVEKWRTSLIENGVISLDEYAEIAALSNEQIEESLMPDPVLSSTRIFNWPLIGARMILRLYRLMDIDQKEAIFSPTGLDTRTFNLEQAEQALKTYQNRDEDNQISIFIEILANPNRWIVLKAFQEEKEGYGTVYNWIAETNDGEFLRKWRMGLPKIRES